MTEVFYYNTYNQLQRLKLHNMNSNVFVDSTKNSPFEIFCILEDGIIKNTSKAFLDIEAEISDSLLNLLC